MHRYWSTTPATPADALAKGQQFAVLILNGLLYGTKSKKLSLFVFKLNFDFSKLQVGDICHLYRERIRLLLKSDRIQFEDNSVTCELLRVQCMMSPIPATILEQTMPGLI